jgi:hypothetical protein
VILAFVLAIVMVALQASADLLAPNPNNPPVWLYAPYVIIVITAPAIGYALFVNRYYLRVANQAVIPDEMFVADCARRLGEEIISELAIHIRRILEKTLYLPPISTSVCLQEGVRNSLSTLSPGRPREGRDKLLLQQFTRCVIERMRSN